MPSGSTEAREFYNSLKRPVLILSSSAGRGNISIAEAIVELFSGPGEVIHRPIEDFLTAGIVQEDLHRYQFISSAFPWLLALPYKIPLFYYRKLFRERLRRTELERLHAFVRERGIATIVSVSHRQAFWAAVLKRNSGLPVAIYGVLTEFGPSLGWKYIFWEQLNGYVSPVEAAELTRIVPNTVPFQQLPLPARSLFYDLPAAAEPKRHCLVMGGLWGQGQLTRAVELLAVHFPEVHLHVVCGDNRKLERKLSRLHAHRPQVVVYGLLDSVLDLLRQSSCVVTKPGMGTLLEAHAAGRKLFLFPGMPVAEAHNAKYALENFEAEWLSVAAFARWLAPDDGKH